MENLNSIIEGVKEIPLKKISDERGAIYHMLTCEDPHFEKFGEIYFSKIHPGAIKGWHVHKVMTLNYAVISGKIKLVLYDQRENSKTKGNVLELFLGDDNYQLVSIPSGVVNGFKGVGVTDSIVANCATHPHDPKEIERIDPIVNKIPYNWDLKHK